MVGVWSRRYVRLAVAADVVSQDLVMSAEFGNLFLPHSPVGDAGVDEHECRSFSDNVVRDVRAVDFGNFCDGRVGIWHQSLSACDRRLCFGDAFYVSDSYATLAW